MTIEYLRENGLIAYEYVRGSTLYGTNVEGSDIDKGGVFIAPKENVLGLRSTYPEEISDEKHDTTYFEIGRWFELLLKSNPTALESLYIPKEFIIGNVHPAIQYVLDNRDKFLTKQCFNPFMGYGISQIKRSTGYNKLCNFPEDMQRRGILDFCYTFKNQGSQPIKEFFKEHNLDQRYCGLVNIPNMRDVYGVYYDFAAYFKFEGVDSTLDRFYCMKNFTDNFDKDLEVVKRRIMEKEFFHYKGIVEPDEFEKSNEVRICSIPKGEKPICFMAYNKDAYTHECKEYKRWSEWKKNRNKLRFESNTGYNYDAKNMMHTIRLMTMALEIAEGKGFNVRRTNDYEYLIDIRNHKFSYEELMNKANELKKACDEAIKTCTLPEEIDYNYVNNLLIEARKTAYNL